MILDLFAGPGGWDKGADILGLTTPIYGVDLDADACATARAAGYHRVQADVTSLNPADFPHATGLIVSPPCPTFSAAGKRTALGDDYQVILDAITHAGSCEWERDAEGEWVPGCGCTWQEIAAELDGLTDPRSRLIVQAIRFALWLPAVEWVAFEQVPAAEHIWEDITAELFAAGWETCDVINIEAAEYGLPSRRRRTFMIARKYAAARTSPLPSAPMPRRSMAEALGWTDGERVNTRGARRTSGGNEFSADAPAWCLTEKARGWKRVSDDLRLTDGQAGLLVGFPLDYPWQGARSKRFLQAADVVSPIVAAVVLGAVLDLAWERPVRAYLAELYPARRQLELFAA